VGAHVRKGRPDVEGLEGVTDGPAVDDVTLGGREEKPDIAHKGGPCGRMPLSWELST